jgi:hypothetical protein
MADECRQERSRPARTIRRAAENGALIPAMKHAAALGCASASAAAFRTG